MTNPIVQGTRGLEEAMEAVLHVEKEQAIYRAANGMKLCDCGDRWMPSNQERCFVCLMRSPVVLCDDQNCDCRR